MTPSSFQDNLHNYASWRRNLVEAIEGYKSWRERYGLDDPNSANTLLSIIQGLTSDKVTLAFVAEFSRGKTELINALFFGETGVRLLPSTPGRTTMSPTEIFYDKSGGSYIRLLAIETRLEDTPLDVLRHKHSHWKQIELDHTSPEQMQEAFLELIAVKQVTKKVATKLGLYDEKMAAELGVEHSDTIDIPCWRHALISFPHPMLKEGLAILDTPGLNALGSEPELTLNMLPSAQAVIFVIAADTGVTRSDMDMWSNHINKATKAGRQGLAVAMNKIDAMWDDITTDAAYKKSIASQVTISAKTLGLSEDFIFPVSAKQALIAKIKKDPDLYTRSKIEDIEQYLSKNIVHQRQNILLDVIAKDIGFLVTESINLVDNNFAKSSKELQELRQLDFENLEIITQLMNDTRKQQKIYSANYAEFKKSRTAFALQLKVLLSALSPKQVDLLIKSSKYELNASLTTYSMKQIMRKLFDDLRDLLLNCMEITSETQILIKAIHKQFHDDFGFQEIEPQLFKIDPYQSKLEQLFNDGEEYRQSSRVTLTEQSVVVKKLYETLIYKARSILKLAHKDAETWGRNILSPLMHQIMAYKKRIEDRLVVLSSSIESKDKLKLNLDRMDRELQLIIRQRAELNKIIKDIEGEASVFNKRALLLMGDISQDFMGYFSLSGD